jgi:hypothetical protein
MFSLISTANFQRLNGRMKGRSRLKETEERISKE